MGAPKQRWSEEEEAALKAGIAKYGAGKWSTILKDLEFNTILKLRSNVDLKDKWRNMNVMTSGLGSRTKARALSTNVRSSPKPDDSAKFSSIPVERDAEIVDSEPPASSEGVLQNGSSKIPISRLDHLILETICTLKEPRGSSRITIAKHIEERYLAPPNLERLLAADLKVLTENGKLIKVKHQYRTAPSSSPSDLREDPPPLLLKEKQNCCPISKPNTIEFLTKAQVDAELQKMGNMSAQEAATAAARAVAEAEAAIAEAEKAAKEAEAAEADAELARVFAAAAMEALKYATICT